MYEGKELTGLDGDNFDNLISVVYDGAPLINNRAQSVVDTLQAKLAALDEPRPQFVVTDGSYEQKRQAVWLDRFVEGLYYQRRGQWDNTWHMWRHAFLLAAAATGSVALKIFPNFASKRVEVELHNTLDMWVDPIECRYGGPLSYGETTWFDAEMLADTYTKFADDIMRQAGADAAAARGSRLNTSDGLQVKCHTLWRCRTKADEPGKYALVCGKSTLEFEDYEYDSPPFAFYHFRPRLAGFWAASATSTFYDSVVRENQVLARMDEGEARSQTVIQYYDASVVQRSQLSVPKHIVLIPYDGKNGPPPPPFAMPWYGQQAPELMRIHGQNTHDASGVSVTATTGQVPSGMTAGVAIRLTLSQLNERLAPRQRDIVNAVAVKTADLYARAAKELYDEDGSFSSKWYGKGFISEMQGADCLSLPLEICTVQVRPVSEKKNSPADRIQLANELVQQGIITGGDWMDALRTMDTPGVSQRFSRVETWCEKLFDRILYAPASKMRDPGFYLTPPKFLDLDYAMALATDAYLSAQIDDVPDERRQFLLQFLGDLSRKIDQRDMRRAQLGQKQPMPGLPTPGASPGQPSQPALPSPMGS